MSSKATTVVILAAGLGLLAVTAILFQNDERYRSQGVYTTAKVKEAEPVAEGKGRIAIGVTYVYTTRDNATVEGTDTVFVDEFPGGLTPQPGQDISIAYRADNPSNSRITSSRYFCGATLVTGILGLVFLASGILRIVT